MKGKQLSVIFGQARIKVSLDKLRYLSDWNSVSLRSIFKF
jgi:hypothetical protein